MFLNMTCQHLNDPDYAEIGSYVLFSLVKVNLEFL